MTAGVFLPAFAFTLLGHDALERSLHRPQVHRFLEGLTAGVVGLIAGTTLALMRSSLTGIEAWILFALALGVLFATRAKLAIPALILAAAAWGWWSR
jgi:chromate transporter